MCTAVHLLEQAGGFQLQILGENKSNLWCQLQLWDQDVVLGERKGEGSGAVFCTSLCSLGSVCVSCTEELVSAQGYRPLSLVTSVTSCIVSFPDFVCCLQFWELLDQLSPICTFTVLVLLFFKINWKSLFSPVGDSKPWFHRSVTLQVCCLCARSSNSFFVATAYRICHFVRKPPDTSTQLLLVKLWRKTAVNVSESSKFSRRAALLSFGWCLGLSRVTGYASNQGFSVGASFVQLICRV